MSGGERTNQYGVVPTETKKCLTGLELLTRVMHGTLPAPPIQQTLDFRLIKVDRGSTVFAGIPRFHSWGVHRRPAGFVHVVRGSLNP
jgi:hypothetical protein